MDVPAVVEYAKTLPYVVFVDDNLFTCSQDTQDDIGQVIEENNLNRIVVAACTPKTHEPLFQETLINAGLNKYLFEMANIRNQDSWVHMEQPGGGHRKGQGPGAHGRRQGGPVSPCRRPTLEVNQTALVIGGGHRRHDGRPSPGRPGVTET